MTTQLGIYNMALLHCGESPLVALTDNVPQRYKLDAIWSGNLITRCLEQGTWDFAKRTQQLDYEPSIEPDFGYRKAFVKPDDFIRLIQISSGEYFTDPLLGYEDDPGHWFCDLEQIYVQYVSDDELYGGDLSLWPGTFVTYVEYYLAAKLAQALTKSETLTQKLEKKEYDTRADAQNKNCAEQPTRFLPRGSWSRSRHGFDGNRYRTYRGQ